jgi:uncharacterized protein YecE (DUF72 family)
VLRGWIANRAQTGHESVAGEVLQLLGQIAEQLTADNVAHLTACFERMNKSEYTVELLHFLSEMSKKSVLPAQRMAFLTQLRAVVCDEQATNEIARTAVHVLVHTAHGDTFKPHRYVSARADCADDHRREWLLQLLETVANPLKVQVAASCVQLITHLIGPCRRVLVGTNG